MERTIIDFLREQSRKSINGDADISFHMPGHKGRASIYSSTGYRDFIDGIMSCDITEIPGADALFCPETTIKSVMRNYSSIYGVKHTELLINGSSAGIMAAIMGSVPVGGKMILARNSHHSAFSALRLGGVLPVYLMPETDPDTGLVSGISPDELEYACENNPEASAVLITSPNYYGIMSDISRLSEVAHNHDMLLIVDQAHGAHLRFFDYDADELRSNGEYVPFTKHSAETLGADIVINSIHKTLLSFTGSAVLNICSDRADQPAVVSMLRMLQTTSPSYLLIGSLDINERIMREHGGEIIQRWRDDLTWFYRHASVITGVTVIGSDSFTSHEPAPAQGESVKPEISGSEAVFAMYRDRAGLDYTKINISMSALGISGEQLETELSHRGIIAEMVHGEYVLLMSGAGNIRSDYEALYRALRDISDSYGYGSLRRSDKSLPRSNADFVLDSADVPLEGEYIPLYKAEGRILYDPLIIYPPGSPLACPGEILTIEVITYIARAIERGEKVTGVDEEGQVRVGVLNMF